MKYVDLMLERPLVWGLFAVYLLLTSGLAWLGHRKTRGIESFAVGDGAMNPVVVGITLAASIASTATFVINPGFVYVHGLSALVHFGGAVMVGLVIGLVTLSLGFRRVGARTKAITLPQWIGERYKSRGLAVLFAGINLMSLSFVVLIVGGVSIVMQTTMGLSNLEALVVVVGFTFSYIFIGGTYAHAYTNTLQGAIMAVIAVVIVVSGFHLLSGGLDSVLATLAARDPNLAQVVNPASPLFNSFFSVFVCGVVIGFAVVCQPHILTKALYVKDDRAVVQYLGVSLLVTVVFTGLLLVGLYALLAGMPVEAFLDPQTGVFRQDMVVAVYIAQTFPAPLVAVISVALMAAGMSTLDGILVALSSIAGNDLFLALTRNNLLRGKSPAQRSQLAHRASQVILVLMGITAFVIALNPPTLLGIFGQIGVYGIIAASAAPIVLGIVTARGHAGTATAAALTGLGVHVGLYLGGFDPNPAVTATWAILASCVVTTLGVTATVVLAHGASEASALGAVRSGTPGLSRTREGS
jgi:sodium/pantothenate symporter